MLSRTRADEWERLASGHLMARDVNGSAVPNWRGLHADSASFCRTCEPFLRKRASFGTLRWATPELAALLEAFGLNTTSIRTPLVTSERTCRLG